MDESICKVVLKAEPELGSLMIAIYACLPLSLEKRLGTQREVIRRHKGLLLRAALYALGSSKVDILDILDVNLNVLQLLLESGIEADSTFEDKTPLATTVNLSDDEQYLFDNNLADMTEKVHGITTLLLKHGADPNQIIQGFRY